MDSELSDSCIKAIRASAKPMSIAEIRKACLGRAKPSGELDEALKQLVRQAAIYEWPAYGRCQELFGHRSLRSAVEEAFVAALDDAPLTVPKAGEPVRRALARASEKTVLGELRDAAPQLAAAHKIIQVPVNRQTVVYMSTTYLGRLVEPKPVANSVEQAILDAVERLQPGFGNYVSVSDLRKAMEFRQILDAAVMALADQSKVILAYYDGPRPDTEEDRSRYIEDRSQQLFIGVALPRQDGGS